MKMRLKRRTALALIIALIAGTLLMVFRENPEKTDLPVPGFPDSGSLKWAYQAGTGFSNALTPPTVAGGFVYVGSGNKIYKLDRATGELERSVTLAGSFGFATAALTHATDVEGREVLFAPLSEGRVQAVDADTLESLWVTERLTGQSCLSRVVYDQGYLYYGTWRTEKDIGLFLCYDTRDEDPDNPEEIKTKTWEVQQPGGFYWSEANIEGPTVVFGSEDGQDGYTSPTSMLFSCMKGSTFAASNLKSSDSPVLDTLPTTGDLRSGVALDQATGAYYFTSRAGILYKAFLENDGTFAKTNGVESLSLGGVTTGTPAIWNGKLFVGVQGPTPYGANGHCLCVVDVATMTQILSVPTPGFVQTEPLISKEFLPQGRLEIYLSYNQLPGGIFLATLSTQGAELGLVPERTGSMFTPPPEMQGYGISTLAVDTEGTLYYKNDSCYLMAVCPDDIR